MKLASTPGASTRGVLELNRSTFESDGMPTDEELLLNVTVEVAGFAARDQNWIVATDWERFMVDLRTLERNRQGSATLLGASPDELRIEFFSTDRLGHMAVRGQVGRRTMERFELLLRFGFAFEPDELPRVLRELEALGR